LDFAESPPRSVRRFGTGDTVHAELWVSRSRSATDDLACVFADLSFDVRALRVHNVHHADRFAALSAETLGRRAGTLNNVGGCMGPEHRDEFTGAAWARVATVELLVTGRSPTAGMILAPASSPFVGVAVLGVDRNVDASQIAYGGIELQIQHEGSDRRKDSRRWGSR